MTHVTIAFKCIKCGHTVKTGFHYRSPCPLCGGMMVVTPEVEDPGPWKST